MAVKRQTTVAFHTGVSADPGDDAVRIDAMYADFIVDMKALTGTSVKADLIEVLDQGWSLPYDGQTANFNVGARVTGYVPGGINASGTIVKDTDGGASGTLVLTDVVGKFTDDMEITDDGGTPGAAVVNSSTGGTAANTLGGTWATITATTAGATAVPVENPNVAAGDGDQRKVTSQHFVVQYTFTAVTTADFVVGVTHTS